MKTTATMRPSANPTGRGRARFAWAAPARPPPVRGTSSRSRDSAAAGARRRGAVSSPPRGETRARVGSQPDGRARPPRDHHGVPSLSRRPCGAVLWRYGGRRSLPRGVARMTTTRLLRAPAKVARAGAIRLRTRSWSDWSRLFVMGDALGWALDDEAAYVSGVARRAGYVLGSAEWARASERQSVFHTSHFAALDPLWTASSHRLGLAYFHGRPGTRGFPEFDRAYEVLRRTRPARAYRSHTAKWNRSLSPQASTRRSCIASRSGSSSIASGSSTPRRGAPARGARPPCRGVRRRLVPKGRGWVRRRARTQVDQGP